MTRLAADQVNAWIVKNIIRNLRIECSNSTQVIIKQGSAVGADDGSIVMEAGADITVDITNSGANGLDQGSEASDTWYYIYMIWNPATETVAGLLSASSSAPTLPSGYTKKRLIGAVRNDSSSDFTPFRQADKRVQISLATLLSGVADTSWTSVTISSVVPPISYQLELDALIWTTNTNTGAVSGTINVRPSSAPQTYTQVAYDHHEDVAQRTGSGASTRLLIPVGSTTIQYKTMYDSTYNSANLKVCGYDLNI